MMDDLPTPTNVGFVTRSPGPMNTFREAEPTQEDSSPARIIVNTCELNRLSALQPGPGLKRI